MIGVSNKRQDKKERTLGMAAGRGTSFLYTTLQYRTYTLEKIDFELILTELFA